MKIDWMLAILVVGAALIVWSFWHAQRKPGFDFDMFDLIMENGKVSRLALWYNLAGAVSTWVVIDNQVKGTLTESLFGLWLGAWVGPIIARLVFDKKDMPAIGTTITTKIESKEVTTP